MRRLKIKNLAYNNKWIAGDDYDKDNPLVCLCLDDLCELIQQIGWQPASKPPKEEGEFLVLTVWGPTKDMPFYAKFQDRKWSIPQVKWWIKPPKEE